MLVLRDRTTAAADILIVRWTSTTNTSTYLDASLLLGEGTKP